MNEMIKQWIADQAKKSFVNRVPPAYPAAFISGLTKGIEIAEGFAEFCARDYLPNTPFDWTWFHKNDGTPFTTSQLLEKYLESINKDQK